MAGLMRLHLVRTSGILLQPGLLPHLAPLLPRLTSLSTRDVAPYQLARVATAWQLPPDCLATAPWQATGSPTAWSGAVAIATLFVGAVSDRGYHLTGGGVPIREQVDRPYVLCQWVASDL